MKDISLDIGFWVDSSFSTWKRICHFLLATIITNEKSAVIQIVLPLGSKVSFFFSILQKCFFVLIFQKFDCDMSWCGFIWIYLCGFILFEVCLPPWFCEFVPVAKFEEVFRHYFKFFFSLTLFLLSWNSDGRNVRSFVIVPWVPETVFIFRFSLFSLCCSYWIISIRSLSLLILSSLSSFLLLRPSIILISVIIFFSPKISFWFFFYFLFIYETLCFFAETFCLFICSKHVHHWSVKHFHNGCFKNSFPVILTSL